MWSIALKTLFADRGKLCTALVGVVFSVVLVNIQGGLFFGLIEKAALLVDHGQADIWIGHKRMHNVDFPRDIPRRWIHRVRSVPGVQSAEPYLVGFSDMTLPNGGFEGVVVVGVDPKSLEGIGWNIVEGRLESVRSPDGVMIDQCDSVKLQYPQLGDVREIGGRRARIVAKSYGVLSFLVAPYVFTTHARAAAFLRKSPEMCSYFLLRLKNDADFHRVRALIQKRVPELEVLSRDEYSLISIDFWLKRTGLGISFGAATCLGLFVGLTIVGQTMHAMVLDRLGEYGALKAMGATERQLYSLLLSQALILAICGSVVGLGVVFGVQQVFSTPRASIVVPWQLSVGACLLMVVICVFSSSLPYWRIRKVDPVMVLQQ